MIEQSRQWFLALLVGVIAITALPRPAVGQTTTTTSTTTIAMGVVPVQRIDDDTGRPMGTDQTLVRTITRADCESTKLKYRFSLTVKNYQLGQTLQAWGSRAMTCANEFTTASDVTRACWQLTSSIGITNGVATVDLTPRQLLGIGALQRGTQQILKESCAEAVTDTGKKQFSVQFLLIGATTGTPEAQVSQPMIFALVGPNPPALNFVKASDHSLELNWGVLTTATSEVSYEFYCAPNESKGEWIDEATGDSSRKCKSSVLEQLGSGAPDGSSAAAGAGGSSSTGTGGTASAGVAGEAGSAFGGSAGESDVSSSDDGTISAGEGGSNGTDAVAGVASTTPTRCETLRTLEACYCGVATGRVNTSGYTDTTLDNGTSYAVAIAVRDNVGNVGALSPYSCGTPEQIDTFYETYRKKGGKARGGFCSLDIHPRYGTLPAAFGAIGLAAWLRRRQRRAQCQCKSVPRNH